MLTWFKLNELKVNAAKFQLILFDKSGVQRNAIIEAGGYIIETKIFLHY